MMVYLTLFHGKSHSNGWFGSTPLQAFQPGPEVNVLVAWRLCVWLLVISSHRHELRKSHTHIRPVVPVALGLLKASDSWGRNSAPAVLSQSRLTMMWPSKTRVPSASLTKWPLALAMAIMWDVFLAHDMWNQPSVSVKPAMPTLTDTSAAWNRAPFQETRIWEYWRYTAALTGKWDATSSMSCPVIGDSAIQNGDETNHVVMIWKKTKNWYLAVSETGGPIPWHTNQMAVKCLIRTMMLNQWI